MSADNEARARKLEQRYRDLCTLADDEGTTPAESDTARRLARGVAKQMRALGWEPGALPPLVDVETSIPGFEHLNTEPAPPTVATITVHGHRAKPYEIAAPYTCLKCGHGRLTGYCALCDVRTEVTPRGVFADGPQGWKN